MKKDIFNRFVEHYLTNSSYKFYKHTVKDSYECYLFTPTNSGSFELINKLKTDMLYLKDNGIKTHEDIKNKYSIYNLINRFICIGYDRVTNKFSIYEYTNGYRYSIKKQRYYPFNSKTPQLVFSKRVYMFSMIKGVQRIQLFTGKMNQYDYKTWGTLILGRNADTSLPICITNYFDEFDEYALLEKKLRIKIPKVLKVFKCAELYKYIKPLKNKQEINTLCQFISKHGACSSDHKNPFQPVNEYNLTATITEMMLGNFDNIWLIRDYVDDLNVLNLKYSFRLRSVARIKDEHNKMSKMRMIKEMKEIKTHDKYRVLVDNFPFSATLIDDKKTLLQESITQNHCVATYGDRINSGRAAIFTMNHGGKRWTAEVSITTVVRSPIQPNVTNFHLNQLRGYDNEDSPGEMKALITQYLLKFNTQPSSELIEMVDF